MAESLSWWVGLNREELAKESGVLAAKTKGSAYSASFDPCFQADTELRKRQRERIARADRLSSWRESCAA